MFERCSLHLLMVSVARDTIGWSVPTRLRRTIFLLGPAGLGVMLVRKCLRLNKADEIGSTAALLYMIFVAAGSSVSHTIQQKATQLLRDAFQEKSTLDFLEAVYGALPS